MPKILLFLACSFVFNFAHANDKTCALDLGEDGWHITNCSATETHPVTMQNFTHALKAALEIPSHLDAVIKRESKIYQDDSFRYQLVRQRDLIEQIRESSLHLQDLIENWPWDVATKTQFVKAQSTLQQNALKSVNIDSFVQKHNLLVNKIIEKLSSYKKIHVPLVADQIPKALAGIFASRIFVAAPLQSTLNAIPPGQYTIGSKDTDGSRFKDEVVQKVQIKEATLIQADLFTQAEWFQLVGSNPARFKSATYCPENHETIMGTDLCPDHPIENISANDVEWALQFLNSSSTAKCGLPTESDWEVASRAGKESIYWFGDSKENLDKYVYYEGNSHEHTHKVSSKERNSWGLGDASGNVWQMTSSMTTPENKSFASTKLQVLKGGSWTGGPRIVRPATRLGIDPKERYSNVGFRIGCKAP